MRNGLTPVNLRFALACQHDVDSLKWLYKNKLGVLLLLVREVERFLKYQEKEYTWPYVMHFGGHYRAMMDLNDWKSATEEERTNTKSATEVERTNITQEQKDKDNDKKRQQDYRSTRQQDIESTSQQDYKSTSQQDIESTGQQVNKSTSRQDIETTGQRDDETTGQ